MREDVALYIEKGLITMVSLNIRAGQRETARRFLARSADSLLLGAP